MRIAIPIRDGCVSPAFDFALRLLLVELEGDGEPRRKEIVLVPESSAQRAGKLRDFKVDTLICGAISRELAWWVTETGINILAYVTGPVDSVLEAYITGGLAKPRFTLPGCWPGARNGFRRCCRRRRGRS
ncbi:MAG: NifB/NifX family molybdenum-iron cluster-binding protein [Sedimentisphaerales bacterium]|nr:NifB/NifX family molybdenum-iron cluster-binding protein [Sedimentisphaerales bacterium]